MTISRNVVFLVGNLGRDPEARILPAGTTVCNVSIATTDRFKKGEDWQEKTEWHDLVMFGKTAEYVAENAKKGDALDVMGSLQNREWEDKEGNKKTKTSVKVMTAIVIQKQGDYSNRSKTPVDDDVPF